MATVEKTQSDNLFMLEAIKEAEKALELGEVPVGAVVVCENKIIARAHNQTEQLIDATAHAEIIALSTASYEIRSKYLNECTLYVTLEPCVMCAGALYWAQLQRLVIGAADPLRGFSTIEKPLLHPKTIIVKDVHHARCKELLDDFFKRVRNK